jgi:hypothetical protein
MGIEGEHRDRQPGFEGHVEHTAVPEVDSVKRSDRYRTHAAR